VSRLPKDPGEREHVVQQILKDTGAFCRVVLAMDTDRDQKGEATSEIGKGGVRASGPHQEVITFLDDWNPERPFKNLMCPRFAYKSSMVEGLIVRCILAYPNISILLMMANKEDAQKRVSVIRDILEQNEEIRELFPDIKCGGSKYSFTTNLRDNITLQSPTLRAGSPQNVPVGGRFNLIVFDDLADDVNTRTDEGLKKGIETVKASIFLRAMDAIVLNVATPRHDGDVSAWMMEQEGWARCTHLDVGFDLVQNSDGKLEWVGENQIWPHLTKRFLNSQITGGIDYSMLMAQYKLRVVAGLHSAFKRHNFQPFNWKEGEHSQLTGYLLTDVAHSSKKDSSLNVLMYVGINKRGHVFILDLQVGRWEMLEFCDRFHKMRAQWSGRVNHQSELLEQQTPSNPYFGMLRGMAKDRGVKLNLIPIQRNAASKGKDMRIVQTQYRFQSREVFVNNELTGRTCVLANQVRVLWEPEGYIDKDSGAKLPDGELVMQFVRHPFHVLKDIPDTFALIEEMDRETGRLVCFWRRPSPQANLEATIRPVVARTATGQGYTSRVYERFQRRR
jgi:hypothetical protein